MLMSNEKLYNTHAHSVLSRQISLIDYTFHINLSHHCAPL